jgi:hypothetical protein
VPSFREPPSAEPQQTTPAIIAACAVVPLPRADTTKRSCSGYIASQFPAGILSQLVGGKIMLTANLVGHAVLMLLLPTAAVRAARSLTRCLCLTPLARVTSQAYPTSCAWCCRHGATGGLRRVSVALG